MSEAGRVEKKKRKKGKKKKGNGGGDIHHWGGLKGESLWHSNGGDIVIVEGQKETGVLPSSRSGRNPSTVKTCKKKTRLKKCHKIKDKEYTHHGQEKLKPGFQKGDHSDTELPVITGDKQ